MLLSKLCEEVKPSEIRKMYNKAQQYDSVISFTLGEPDFTASENVVKVGCDAIKKGYTKYTPNIGINPLRESISKYLDRLYNINYNSENEIIVTPGAMGALYMTLKVILNKGDEVIVCDPSWTNYAQQIIMNGGIPVMLKTTDENNFMIDINQMASLITPKTKCVILNSPCNPTGTILSRDNLEDICKLVIKHDLFVIFDEVYKHIIYDNEEFTSICTLPNMKERTILIDSFSKSYAMTGWRVGYAAGPSQIIDNMVKFQESISACVVMSNQYAAIEALEGPQDHLHYMVENYKNRRDFVIDRVNKMPKVSCKKTQGTFYAFVNIKETGLSSNDFAMKLLEEKQVVVVPGTAFGESGDGFIRISYATSMEEIEDGLKRMKEFLEEL